MKTPSLIRLAALPFVFTALALLTSGAAQATTSPPQQLYRALLKPAAASSLPSALAGSGTHAAKLSAGSRAQHAVGAVEIGNNQAIVGYLVFPTHAGTLADLKAFPPNAGPNKLLSRSPAGFPRPAYLIHALHNGYEVAYVVFVMDNVLVNSWAYGPKGSEKKLIAIVTRNGLWARDHARSVMHGVT